MDAILTNKDLITFHKTNGAKKTVEHVLRLSAAAGSNYSNDINSVRSAVKRTISTSQNLNKNKSKNGGLEKITEFESNQFQFPQKLLCIRQTLCSYDEEDVDLAPKSKFRAILNSYKNTAEDCLEETESLKREVKELKQSPKVVKQSRLTQRKEKANSLSKELTRMRKRYDIVKRNNTARIQEIKKLKLKVNYREKQSNNLHREIMSLSDKVATLEEENNNFQAQQDIKDTEIRDLFAENECLREFVSPEIKTFDEEKKCFTSDLQVCVYSLLTCNVSCSQISSVIEHVLKLANRTASKLPSRSTVNNMNVQRLILSQKQLGEEFAERKNTCLLGDETSKYGHKYQGIHAADAEARTWALGIREMCTKSSQRVLTVLQEILGDIEQVSEASENEIAKEILLNITYTMSDRASTQLKFNELLEEFRVNVLKDKMADNWDTLSIHEQQSLSKLCNLFCALHLLVHLADAAAAALKESDNAFFGNNPPILDKSFLKSNEPGAIRLLRIACKAFARGGDEKNGAHMPFATFLQDFLTTNKLNSIPLERFKGNRFNIIFSSGSNVFYLHDQMKAFLEFGASNRLLQAVQFDLGIQEYLAGCKALGLVSELITKPLWCKIEDSNITIMQMGTQYKELVQYMENMDYAMFMEGNYLLSGVDKEQLQKSVVFSALMKPSEYDNKVQVILQVIIPSLLSVMKRILKDHVEGGKWDNPTQELENKTKGVPKHNKYSESVFGYLDRFLKEKPNSSTLAMEAYILFCHNKTLDWLDRKTDKERRQLVDSARKEEKKMRKQFKERKHNIKLERQRLLQEKIREEERKKK